MAEESEYAFERVAIEARDLRPIRSIGTGKCSRTVPSVELARLPAVIGCGAGGRVWAGAGAATESGAAVGNLVVSADI